MGGGVNMTQQELIQKYLSTEHGVFPCRFTFDAYNQETDEYDNLVIVKTAEEVYQEWLESKDKQTKILSTEEKIEELAKGYLEVRSTQELIKSALLDLIIE